MTKTPSMDQRNSPGLLKRRYWQAYQRTMDWIDPFPYWRYTDKHRCLFIHIPKTAGTSVIQAIGARRRIHLPWWVYQFADPRRFRDYFKFCFVRNPWDRAVSTYFYLKSGGAGLVDAYFTRTIQDQYTSFDSFVMDFLDESRIHEHELLRPQYLYIHDIAGNCMVDFVGRFESIDEDFRHVADKLGVDAQLPVSNKSARTDYAQYYSPAHMEKIGRLYHKDIALFGYRFGT